MTIYEASTGRKSWLGLGVQRAKVKILERRSAGRRTSGNVIWNSLTLLRDSDRIGLPVLSIWSRHRAMMDDIMMDDICSACERRGVARCSEQVVHAGRGAEHLSLAASWHAATERGWLFYVGLLAGGLPSLQRRTDARLSNSETEGATGTFAATTYGNVRSRLHHVSSDASVVSRGH